MVTVESESKLVVVLFYTTAETPCLGQNVRLGRLRRIPVAFGGPGKGGRGGYPGQSWT